MAMTMKSATFTGARVAPVQRSSVRARAAPATAALRDDVAKFAKAAGVGIATLGLALSANAATVKLGEDGGGLAFSPKTITIKAGESVEWVNNVGFPHNVVFDEDDIPDGANAEALSHEDYLNAPGQSVSSKFTTPGSYGYYCEPHQGAGMVGKVIVQ